MKRKRPVSQKRLLDWGNSGNPEIAYFDYCFGISEYPKHFELYSDFFRFIRYCSWLVSSMDDFKRECQIYYSEVNIPCNKHEFLKFKRKLLMPLKRKING